MFKFDYKPEQSAPDENSTDQLEVFEKREISQNEKELILRKARREILKFFPNRNDVIDPLNKEQIQELLDIMKLDQAELDSLFKKYEEAGLTSDFPQYEVCNLFLDLTNGTFKSLIPETDIKPLEMG